MHRPDAKVVLLGKENSGKTCLAARFIHGKFFSDSCQSTVGAGYASCRIEIDKKFVSLGIWDTAGSERFESMSRIYYRNARIGLVCFSLVEKDSWIRAKQWVMELLGDEEGCKIYICGTKKDLIKNERAVDPSLILQFSRRVGAEYFETSSKTGENVKELFHSMARSVLAEDGYPIPTESIELQYDYPKQSSCCYNFLFRK